VFYEAQLAMLEQLSQTRTGATQLLDAGLFEAVRDSQLFSADPDIGLGTAIPFPLF
jgi:nuclear pore complex protein Nup205